MSTMKCCYCGREIEREYGHNVGDALHRSINGLACDMCDRIVTMTNKIIVELINGVDGADEKLKDHVNGLATICKNEYLKMELKSVDNDKVDDSEDTSIGKNDKTTKKYGWQGLEAGSTDKEQLTDYGKNRKGLIFDEEEYKLACKFSKMLVDGESGEEKCYCDCFAFDGNVPKSCIDCKFRPDTKKVLATIIDKNRAKKVKLYGDEGCPYNNIEGEKKIATVKETVEVTDVKEKDKRREEETLKKNIERNNNILNTVGEIV